MTGVTLAERRRLLMSPDAVFNGIDFAEARPGRRGQLDIHFINRVRLAGTLAPDRRPVTLDGGPGVAELTVRPVYEDTAWSTDTSGRPVLHLTADVPDVRSRCVVTVHSDSLDPCLRSATVTFPGQHDGETDCTIPPATPQPTAEPVPIDYLSKDFASFCLALSNFSAARYPQWVERSEADVGVMLMEALSALADELSYLQDRVAAEATLDTATQRLSLVRHARLVGYEPAPAIAATTIVQFDVAAPLTGVMQCQAAGAQGEIVNFAAGPDLSGLGLAIPGIVGQVPGSALDPRWNRYADQAGTVAQLVPYLWDPEDTCLRPGATSMWISGHGHGFYPGQQLLIDTAGADAGDLPVREIVQVTKAAEHGDPVLGQDVTLIRWAEHLTAEHDLARTQLAGNLVPAVQGKVTQETFAIPGDATPAGSDATAVALATVRADHAGSPSHCLYTLTGPLVWQLVPAPDGGPATMQPALTLEALPGSDGQETVAWPWTPWLLDAEGTARAFTVTAERYSPAFGGDPSFRDYNGDGVTIRFGDGTFGRPPVPGTTFRAQYLAGGGSAGNVSADAVTGAAPGDPSSRLVWRCTNPFAATGGTDRETTAQIRDRAPQEATAGLLTLTRPADYESAALSFGSSGAAVAGWARQAIAAFRWTGSWLSALTIVDPLLAEPAAAQSGALAGLARLLDARRLAGSASSVAIARYRRVDLRIFCLAQPGYLPGDVTAAVLARLDPRPGSGGSTGFFGRDRWTFGQPLEAPALTAAIQSCAGVAGITLIEYRDTLDSAPWSPLPEIVRVAPGEILRVDNDPNKPQCGLISVTAEATR
jgi:hypothetical protein